MRMEHQLLDHEARVALEAEPRGGAAALTVRSSLIVSFDLVLPAGGADCRNPPAAWDRSPAPCRSA